MRYKLLGPLSLGVAVVVTGCAEHHLPKYTFTVSGMVATEDGSPVEDAEIILELNGLVYEVALPVKTVGRLTNAEGSFAFSYTTHERGVGYVITVSKDGFETQSVKGSAPPAAYHAILLKKVTDKSAPGARVSPFGLWQERTNRPG